MYPVSEWKLCHGRKREPNLNRKEEIMKKKLGYLFLTGLMALSLAACGKGSQDAGGQDLLQQI